MKTEILIPHVGATGGDVRILVWLVRPGDFVTEGTPLVTIETDKATEDIEAYSKGYVDEILAEAGSDVPVGTVIATLRETQDKTQFGVEADQIAFAEGKLSHRQPLPNWVPKQLKSITAAETERIFASPAARRLAREKNIDLSSLSSGGGGRTIHLAHVQQAISSKAGDPSTPQPSKQISGLDRQIRPVQATTIESTSGAIASCDKTTSNGSSPTVNRVRRVIAERVTQSKAEIPHFYMSTTIDMTEANLARAWLLKATETSAVIGPTINDLIVRATAFALRDTPRLNTLFRNNGLETLSSIDVGIVIGIEDGVLIPIVRNADQLDIYALAETTRALKLAAQEGKLTSRDLKGGAISVSNLGMYGVESFTAIIDPAQSSILACGAVKQNPAVHNGEVVVRELMTVTLSVDHRIADGVLAANFLSRFKHYSEIPQLLITGKGSLEK